MRKAGSRAAGLAGAATLRDEGGRYVASRTLLRGCCGSCEVAAAGWGGGDAAVVEGVAAGLAGGTSLVVGSADVEGAGLRAAGPGGDRVREQLVSVASIKLSACYARFLRPFINCRAGVHVEGSWRCLLGVQTRFREMEKPLGM